MGPLRPNRPSDHVASYLARGEVVVMEMKQHWARLLPAIASCGAGFLLVIVAGLSAPAWMGTVTNAAWWIWLVLLAHLAWRVLEWHDETFVITNKRLILVHGLFVKKVAMMPLAKVTDMSYNRSPAARILGYGTFKIESAGQEQALSVIDFVRDPDEKYRDICGLIFGLDDDDAPHTSGVDHDDDLFRDDDGAAFHTHDDGYRTFDNRTFDDEVYDVDMVDDDAFDDEPVERDVPTMPSASRTSKWYDDADPLESDTPDAITVDATVPIRTRARRHSRGSDETDPHGIITVGVASPRPRPQGPYADDEDVTDVDTIDDDAWSVSREHAARPQTTQPIRHPDRLSTWRDSQ